MTSIALPMGISAAQGRAAMQQMLDDEVARLRGDLALESENITRITDWDLLNQYMQSLNKLHADLRRATDNAAAYRSATDTVILDLEQAA